METQRRGSPVAQRIEPPRAAWWVYAASGTGWLHQLHAQRGQSKNCLTQGWRLRSRSRCGAIVNGAQGIEAARASALSEDVLVAAVNRGFNKRPAEIFRAGVTEVVAMVSAA